MRGLIKGVSSLNFRLKTREVELPCWASLVQHWPEGHSDERQAREESVAAVACVAVALAGVHDVIVGAGLIAGAFDLPLHVAAVPVYAVLPGESKPHVDLLAVGGGELHAVLSGLGGAVH